MTNFQDCNHNYKGCSTSSMSMSDHSSVSSNSRSASPEPTIVELLLKKQEELEKRIETLEKALRVFQDHDRVVPVVPVVSVVPVVPVLSNRKQCPILTKKGVQCGNYVSPAGHFETCTTHIDQTPPPQTEGSTKPSKPTCGDLGGRNKKGEPCKNPSKNNGCCHLHCI